MRALKRLVRDTVRGTRLEIPEVEPLLLERRLRCASEDALDQAWLLAELQERFSLSLDELARRFTRSKSWVSRRLGLLQALPAQVHEQVRSGALAGLARRARRPLEQGLLQQLLQQECVEIEHGFACTRTDVDLLFARFELENHHAR